MLFDQDLPEVSEATWEEFVQAFHELERALSGVTSHVKAAIKQGQDHWATAISTI